MQLSSIFSACARNGVAVTQPQEHRKDYYVLRKGDRVLDFYAGSDGYVGHITCRHPDTDAMTDLFMDTYHKTIKDSMQYLNPTGEKVSTRSVRSVNLSKPINSDDVPNDVQVFKNDEKGGIEIKFNEKPDEIIRASLKDRKFQYSPFFNVWWKRFNGADYVWAIETFSKFPQLI